MQRLLVLVAPAAALALGVWAEFADLTPGVLSAVAVPAIVVSAWGAARLVRLPLPVVLVLAGTAMGVLTFGIAETTHVVIHVSLGRTLDFGGQHSEAAKAFALIGIHLGVGAVIGAGLGVALAVLALVGRRLGVLRQAQHDPLPSSTSS